MAGRVSRNRAKKRAAQHFMDTSGKIGASAESVGGLFGNMKVSMWRNRY